MGREDTITQVAGQFDDQIATVSSLTDFMLTRFRTEQRFDILQLIANIERSSQRDNIPLQKYIHQLRMYSIEMDAGVPGTDLPQIPPEVQDALVDTERTQHNIPAEFLVLNAVLDWFQETTGLSARLMIENPEQIEATNAVVEPNLLTNNVDKPEVVVGVAALVDTEAELAKLDPDLAAFLRKDLLKTTDNGFALSKNVILELIRTKDLQGARAKFSDLFSKKYAPIDPTLLDESNGKVDKRPSYYSLIDALLMCKDLIDGGNLRAEYGTPLEEHVEKVFRSSAKHPREGVPGRREPQHPPESSGNMLVTRKTLEEETGVMMSLVRKIIGNLKLVWRYDDVTFITQNLAPLVLKSEQGKYVSIQMIHHKILKWDGNSAMFDQTYERDLREVIQKDLYGEQTVQSVLPLDIAIQYIDLGIKNKDIGLRKST